MNPFLVFLFSISNAWTRVRTSSYEAVVCIGILTANLCYLLLIGSIVVAGIVWIKKAVKRKFGMSIAEEKAGTSSIEEDDVGKKDEAPEEEHPADPEVVEEAEQKSEDPEEENDLTLLSEGGIAPSPPPPLPTSSVQNALPLPTPSCELPFTESDLKVNYAVFCPHLEDTILFVYNYTDGFSIHDVFQLIFNVVEMRFEKVRCRSCNYRRCQNVIEESELVLMRKRSDVFDTEVMVVRSDDGYIQKKILIRRQLERMEFGMSFRLKWVLIKKDAPIVFGPHVETVWEDEESDLEVLDESNLESSDSESESESHDDDEDVEGEDASDEEVEDEEEEKEENGEEDDDVTKSQGTPDPSNPGFFEIDLS